MRVLAGRLRGKKIIAPEGLETRPFPDRLRKSLFQVIENHWGRPLGAESALDLYAGSGSLGLEAASRGVRSVSFVERDHRALIALNANRKAFEASLGGDIDLKILKETVESALRRLKREGAAFKLIFADPPFLKDLAGAALEEAESLLDFGGWMVVRRHEAEAVGDPPTSLRLREERKYGMHVIAVYEKPEP